MLKREIRNSILPLNIKGIDMINSHPTILLYLCQKNKLNCNILKDYVKNRECILEKFGDNRKIVKEMILTLLNGGFKNNYHSDKNINDYFKKLEKEVIYFQDYFHENDKTFSDESVFNFKGKNLSKIILNIENKMLQTMIDYFKDEKVPLLTLDYDGLKIFTNKISKHHSIDELEKMIFKKFGISMKLAFKNIEDYFD